MKRIICACLLAGLMLHACKKDHDPSTKELILGKWNFEKVVITSLATSMESTTEKPAGSYVDFAQNGRLIINTGGQDIQATWELTEPQGLKLHISPPTVYTIKEINENQLIFFFEHDENGEKKRTSWYLSKPYAEQ